MLHCSKSRYCGKRRACAASQYRMNAVSCVASRASRSGTQSGNDGVSREGLAVACAEPVVQSAVNAGPPIGDAAA